jgi:ribonuclease D
MKEYFVDTPKRLQDLCERLRGSAALALDTEFLRERTFYAKLCLLQVATEELVACVDPLALPTLEPLLDVIYDPKVVKVMHAGRQDLEILFDLRGDVPRPVYDTQIAATLLGFGDQVSYQTLVRDTLGVELEKTHTRTNWEQRPLDSGQIRYAQDDVRYLHEVWHRQRRQLVDKGRLEWLDDDFADLTDIRNYDWPAEEAWQRIRGIRVLKEVQLAVLRELATWREHRAREYDRPRKWVLRDDVIIDLARHMPMDGDALKNVRGLDARTRQRIGSDIIHAIRRAQQLPAGEWPTLGFRFTPTPAEEALIDAMMAIVRQCGIGNGISPAALASRRDLEQLISGREDAQIEHGWRGRLLGRHLRAFLGGELQLQVERGALQFRPLATDDGAASRA